MDSLNKKICLAGLLFLIITADFSSMCKHGSGKAFAYAGKPVRPVSAAYKLAPVAVPVPAVFQTNTITWKQLADVSQVARYNKQFEMDIMYPVFGSSVKKLAGKQWIISGYMVPLDIKSGLYALSQNTYAACFFCGAAGVESVISLKFKSKPKRYHTDEYCYIKGTLELNDSNVNDFIYIFRDAEEIKK